MVSPGLCPVCKIFICHSYADFFCFRFTTREIFDTLPLIADFEFAQDLLQKFDELLDPETHEKTREFLYETVVVPMRHIWDTRAINAFPLTYKEAAIAIEDDITATHQPNATRSLEWLQENGKCIDNIVPRQSTIEGAGRGAFAKRNLPKGSIITGSKCIIAFSKGCCRFLVAQAAFKRPSSTSYNTIQRKLSGHVRYVEYCNTRLLSRFKMHISVLIRM